MASGWRRARTAASLELRAVHAAGHEVWLSIHTGVFAEGGANAPCLILQAQDISARRSAESQLNHIAFHDSLTGLANRAASASTWRRRSHAARATHRACSR